MPAELGQLQSLKELHLHNNEIEEVPIELEQLQSLDWLDLYNNQIKEVPVELGRLQSLEELCLDGNPLDPSQPTTPEELRARWDATRNDSTK